MISLDLTLPNAPTDCILTAHINDLLNAAPLKLHVNNAESNRRENYEVKKKKKNEK